MPQLVKDGALCEDRWQMHSEGDIAPNSLVPLSLWLEQQEQLASRDDIGVWLDSADDVHQLGASAAQLPIIAINFPGFMDGRGFSMGRILRDRYGFKGELRAIGQFIRDQLCYLRRVGFNAFALSDDINTEGALASLNDFTEYYQAGVDQPTPLFRRR